MLLASAETATSVYPPTYLDALISIVEGTNSIDDEDVILASRVVLKLLEKGPAYEEHLISNKERLYKFMITFLGLASYVRNDDENADLSKAALGAVGNLSTHVSFTDAVKISKSDSVFKMIVELLDGTFECPRVFQSTTAQVEHYNLFKGIACLLLGNLATSLDNVETLLEEIPELVEQVMAYFKNEADPFALQGAHLVKNITTSSKLPCVKVVAQQGGVGLVQKLVGMKLFSNLRVLGVHIGKNLLVSIARLYTGEEESIKVYCELARILTSAYAAEDTPNLKNEFVLAADVSIAEMVNHISPSYNPAVLAAVNEQGLIVLDYLYNLYKSGGEVNAVVTLKATKTLGVLAGTMTPSSSKPLLEQALGESEDTEATTQRLVDILGQFSGQLMEAKPKDSDTEVASQTFRGIINNLGFIGAKLQHSSHGGLAQASDTAIRNASL